MFTNSEGSVFTILEGSVFTNFEGLVFTLHLGTVLAHFLEMDRASPKVVALCNAGILFHTLAMMLFASIEYPGTGCGISFEVVDLVDFKLP